MYLIQGLTAAVGSECLDVGDVISLEELAFHPNRDIRGPYLTNMPVWVDNAVTSRIAVLFIPARMTSAARFPICSLWVVFVLGDLCAAQFILISG